MLKLLRPKQWSKNVFVFAALLFTRSYSNPYQVKLALLAFAAMCLLSSATYVFNDIVDVERDRNHPKKMNRPLASGAVPMSIAIVLGLMCLLAGLFIAWNVSRGVLFAALIYLGLQLAYNFGLKRVPIADVFILALGFVLRAAVGAVAIHVQISGWLLFCTGSLALLLGFGKRRHEFMIQGEERGRSRESLVGYSQMVLDAFVILSAGGAAMCYGIYSLESKTAKQFPMLVLSSIFVIYGICRYVLLVFSSGEGGEPESLVVSDVQMIITFLLFAASVLFAMSGVSTSFIG